MTALSAILSFSLMPMLVFAQTDARASFDKMKTFAGEWEGTVSTVPPEPAVQDKTTQVTIRVTSRGNAVLHEMKIAGIPDDPITMIYVEQERLRLTHYCDAGNRPRMEAKASDDKKTLQFEMIDISGSTEKGHMHKVAFASIDPDHHTEEWSYTSPDGKAQILARFDLRRKK